MRAEFATAFVLLGAVVCGQAPLRLLDGAFADVAPEAFGDFDGDGDIDAVSASTVFVNEGTGVFTPVAAPTLAAPLSVSTVLAADFNGDGLADLLRTDYPIAVRISLNLGGFAFADVLGLPPIPFGLALAAADVGDVDQDGDLDLMLAWRPTIGPNGSIAAAGTAVLWSNVGGVPAVPAAPAQFPSIAVPSGRAFLRDLDLDGDLDALFAGTNVNGLAPSVAVLTNAGGGTFVAGAAPAGAPIDLRHVELGDFDGDGRPDLFGIGTFGAASRFAVFPNSAAGFQAPTLGPVAPFALSVLRQAAAAVDADGDGNDELLVRGLLYDVVAGVVGPVLQDTGTDFVLPNDVFFADGRISGAPAGRDLDGDGDADLVVRAGAETVRLMNAGSNEFAVVGGRIGAALSISPIPAIKTAPLVTTGVHATGDFDGDGDLDALSVDFYEALLRTALNDGSGVFAAGPTSSVAALGAALGYVDFVAIDVDQDGDDDLYGAGDFRSSGFGAPIADYLLVNLGGGSFGPPIPTTATGSVAERAVVDWDGDGDLDLLLGRRTFGGVGPPTLYVRNLGGGSFAAPVAVGGVHATFGLLVADFDGDGDPDLLQVNGSFQPPPVGHVEQSVLYLNAGGAFVAVAQPSMTGFWAAAGDLNGDGMADAVVDNAVWFATASGVFAAASVLASPPVNRMTAADVDEDGDLDLVESPCTVLPNLGGGSFGPPQPVLPRRFAVPVQSVLPYATVADLDRDGDLDVLTPDPRVVVNVSRQIDHRDAVRLGGTTVLDVYGAPGGAWFLYAAPATGFIPTPYGAVLIDPASALFVASGDASRGAVAVRRNDGPVLRRARRPRARGAVAALAGRGPRREPPDEPSDLDGARLLNRSYAVRGASSRARPPRAAARVA
jgi:hypothetical protein